MRRSLFRRARSISVVVCLAWVTLLVGALAWPKPARAQPAAGDASAAPVSEVDAKREEARKRFVKGLELVQNESWDAALAEFLASRELFPTQVALKNAAISLRQLKRNAEALSMYEELVQRFSDKLSPADKQSVNDAMTQLQRLVGEITVESNQAGARIVVDGQERGNSPLPKPVRVDAGTRSVRVFKEGFIPFETQVSIAGAQKKVVRATLSALAQSGKLAVQEAGGKTLEVVVDGATVGKTPWTGVLSIGTHTVFLRGEGDVGSPPTAAEVRANGTTTLRLEAVVLDGRLRVEPTPANARIDIDGVELGNGVWEGRLKSGAHKVELLAEGFLPYRRDVRLSAGQPEVLRVALERDLSSPMWSTFRPHVYVQLQGGLALGPSLGGGADDACSAGDCSDRGRPSGFLVGALGGYQLTSGLGLELFFGYLSVSEQVTRTKRGQADVPARATDYRDKTRLSGPVAALAASYQFFEDTPLTARLWAGVLRATARFENEGTFTGTLSHSSGATFDFSEQVSIPETNQELWVPFVGPEVRFGYRLSRHFMIDAGVAALFMFASSEKRYGTSTADSADPGRGRRSVALRDYPGVFPGNADAQPGNLLLDPDNGLGAFYVLSPSVALRYDF
ncbi:MAG: PEGA domain-containing protein [Myxococcales bacterium]|nr:PEGA domain-containing protein [Myxococcales bacterium]